MIIKYKCTYYMNQTVIAHIVLLGIEKKCKTHERYTVCNII